LAQENVPDRIKSAFHALRAGLTSPDTTRNALGQRTYPVIWDSGASISISFTRNDFVGPIKKPDLGMRLQGIAKGLSVEGIGHVAWAFVDTTGMLRTLKVKALLVPKAKARLLSTSSLLSTYQDETIRLESSRLVLSGVPTDPQPRRNPIEILVDGATNLPIGFAYAVDSAVKLQSAFNSTISVVSEANVNLSPGEKELLRWHFKLCHLSFKRIQFLMRSGVLAHTEGVRRLQTTASKLQQRPVCAACQFGKQRCRSAPGQRRTVMSERVGALKRGNLHPSEKVSVDHFICSTRGRLFTSFSKEDSKLQFSGGCIFVDHSSGFVFVKEQVHLNSHETIESKQAFERMCRDYGVIPQTYLSDNGSQFTSAAFQSHLEVFRQVSQFAGAGAHHHNGIAERNIQTIMKLARTMMLHAALHWPAVANAQLWPMAVQHAVHLFNHMPDMSTGMSPHDLFTRTRWPHKKFQDLHVWGCPVYVLDKTLSDGKKLPRWQPRSSRHVYVGMSSRHASSVPLVLNLDTGAITAQFHVVFDDWFATVHSSPDDLPDFGSPEWDKLFGDSFYNYPFDDDDEPASSASPIPVVDPHQTRRTRDTEAAIAQHAPPQPLPVLVPESPPVPSLKSPPAASAPDPLVIQREPFGHQDAPANQRELPLPSPPRTALKPPPATPPSTASESPRAPAPLPNQREKSPIQSPMKPPSKKPTAGKLLGTSPPTRRSTRERRAPSRHGYDGTQGEHGYFAHFANLLGRHSPLAMSARRSVKDPDIFTFDKAMRAPDREEWKKAAETEIQALVEHGTWIEVPKSEAETRILPGTWTFRYKRTASGELKKRKSRYCVRGDLSDDTDDDTYSPVCAWSSVRMFLTLSLIIIIKGNLFKHSCR